MQWQCWRKNISYSRSDGIENIAKYLGNIILEPSNDKSDGSDDNASDHGLDDYQSNDEAREKFDDENDEDAWARYETRSSGFNFTVDGGKHGS